MTMAQAVKRRYDLLKRKGRCVQCAKVKSAPYARCEGCRERHRR